MPCGCFGNKKKKTKEEEDKEKGLSKGATAPLVTTTTTTSSSRPPPTTGVSQLDSKLTPPPPHKLEDDSSNKTAKRRDVVASYYEDECALLGYRPTGSRPPSSFVDSPTSNNSQTHTPSTVPVIASSTTSQASSTASSPSTSRAGGASSRAELAEKRREFFRDFLPEEKKTFYHNNLPSTLPTVARARQFGKVRPMRPVSQPSPSGDHPPTFPSPTVPEAPPPGPHLLRPVATRGSTKIDASANEQEGGFSSAHFLLELKNASEEISRRWAMSEEELESVPYTLKMRPVRSPTNEEDTGREQQQRVTSQSEMHNNNLFITNAASDTAPPQLSFTLEPSREVVASTDTNSESLGIPETLITPPSPPSVDWQQQQLSPSQTKSTEDAYQYEEPSATFKLASEGENLLEEPYEYDAYDEDYEEEDNDFDALVKLSTEEGDSFDLSDQPLMERDPKNEAILQRINEGIADAEQVLGMDLEASVPDPSRKYMTSESSPGGEEFALERNITTSSNDFSISGHTDLSITTSATSK